MTAFLATAHDIATNAWSAWWPWLLLVGVILTAYCLIVLPLAVAIGRAFKAGNEEYAAEEMRPDPLPAVDATDAEFEQWAMRALGIANSAAFETTAREIRALPETRTR